MTFFKKMRQKFRVVSKHWATDVFITEKILNHPYEYGVAWAMIFSALNLLIRTSKDNNFVLLWFAVCAIISALFIIIGLYWRGKRLMGLTIELYGHLLAALIWAADLVIIYVLTNGQAGFALGVPVALMLAAIVKTCRVYVEKQKYRLAYRRAATINSSRQFREAG